MPQKIYIISEGGDNQACKIGIARDPMKRRSQLQTGNRRHLQLRHIVIMPKGIRARDIETRVHNHLENEQYPGGTEWFQIHPDAALNLVNRYAGIIEPMPWWGYLLIPFHCLGRIILRMLSVREHHHHA